MTNFSSLLLVLGIIAVFYFTGCKSEICFRFIGCFSQKYPWVSITRQFPAPQSPEKINETLFFYSREAPEGQTVQVYPNIVFNVTGFSPNRRTVTITHGFASSASASWVTLMKDKYLENMDANIFLVNWKQGATGNYGQCAANTRVAGAILGRFGIYLIENHSVNYSHFHLIGHSLGAHISSYAAVKMNNKSTDGQKVYRITGLDPAQPGYQSLSNIVRLSVDDAKFVEVVHSDAKPFIPLFGFGYISSLGDVDFYVNRGYDQPSCIDFSPIKNITSINQVVNISVEIITKAVGCSHGRSFEIFTASFDKSTPCKFVGHRLITRVPITSNQFSCGKQNRDCITMGLNTPQEKARGSFQVMTTGRSPYCCYNYSVIFGCSSSPKKSPVPIFG